TVVIMTSNVGARDITKGATLGFAEPSADSSFERMSQKVKDEIEKVFNPEFLNRLDDTIVFHSLDRSHITAIVGIMFEQMSSRLAEEGLSLRRTDAATSFLVEHGYDEQFGARPLRRAIQRFVEDPLSDKILTGDVTKGDEIEVDVHPDGEKLTFRVLSGTKA
ncbi:MAG: AAA family ATPase, partial [Gemmatimonadales bacterium]